MPRAVVQRIWVLGKLGVSSFLLGQQETEQGARRNLGTESAGVALAAGAGGRVCRISGDSKGWDFRLKTIRGYN